MLYIKPERIDLTLNINKCECDGVCYARGEKKICRILTEAYKNNDCPFQKADREVTKGKRYPYQNPLNRFDLKE